jgi:transposase
MTIGCVLFSSAPCFHKRCYSRIVHTTRTGSGSLPASKEHGRTFRRKRNRKDPIRFSPYLYRARNLIERFFNKIKQCRPGTTNSQPTIWRSSSSYQSEFGYALMSPRPNTAGDSPRICSDTADLTTLGVISPVCCHSSTDRPIFYARHLAPDPHRPDAFKPDPFHKTDRRGVRRNLIRAGLKTSRLDLRANLRRMWRSHPVSVRRARQPVPKTPKCPPYTAGSRPGP